MDPAAPVRRTRFGNVTPARESPNDHRFGVSPGAAAYLPSEPGGFGSVWSSFGGSDAGGAALGIASAATGSATGQPFASRFGPSPPRGPPPPPPPPNPRP